MLYLSCTSRWLLPSLLLSLVLSLQEPPVPPLPALQVENHDVRNFAVTVGAAVAPVALPTELTLNGQQYVSNGTFTYYVVQEAKKKINKIKMPSASGVPLLGRAFKVYGALLCAAYLVWSIFFLLRCVFIRETITQNYSGTTTSPGKPDF